MLSCGTPTSPNLHQLHLQHQLEIQTSRWPQTRTHSLNQTLHLQLQQHLLGMPSILLLCKHNMGGYQGSGMMV
jgi:hypothetical protein